MSEHTQSVRSYAENDHFSSNFTLTSIDDQSGCAEQTSGFPGLKTKWFYQNGLCLLELILRLEDEEKTNEAAIIRLLKRPTLWLIKQ